MKKNKIIIFTLVIIWMITIFAFSNTNSIKSNNDSKGIIKLVAVKILNIDDNKVDEIVEKYNKPIRKITHFTIYLILALLIHSALTLTNIKYKKLLTILICLIYAITDEYHQTFINGRTGLLSDVIIDTSGSLTYIILLKIKEIKNNKNYNQNNKKSNF